MERLRITLRVLTVAQRQLTLSSLKCIFLSIRWLFHFNFGVYVSVCDHCICWSTH